MRPHGIVALSLCLVSGIAVADQTRTVVQANVVVEDSKAKIQVAPSAAVPRELSIYVNKWEGYGSREQCANNTAVGNEMYVVAQPIWTTQICRGETGCQWEFEFTAQEASRVCARATCKDASIENCAGTVVVRLSELQTHPPVATSRTVTQPITPINTNLTLCAAPLVNGEILRFESYLITGQVKPYSCKFRGEWVNGGVGEAQSCVSFVSSPRGGGCSAVASMTTSVLPPSK